MYPRQGVRILNGIAYYSFITRINSSKTSPLKYSVNFVKELKSKKPSKAVNPMVHVFHRWYTSEETRRECQRVINPYYYKNYRPLRTAANTRVRCILIGSLLKTSDKLSELSWKRQSKYYASDCLMPSGNWKDY